MPRLCRSNGRILLHLCLFYMQNVICIHMVACRATEECTNLMRSVAISILVISQCHLYRQKVGPAATQPQMAKQDRSKNLNAYENNNNLVYDWFCFNLIEYSLFIHSFPCVLLLLSSSMRSINCIDQSNS